MKKILALLALVLGVVSCQTEPEGLDVNVGGEVETTVCVSLPEATRANSALGAFDNVDLTGAATIRYILQIFDQNDRPSDAEYIKYSDEKSVVFPVRLVPGRHYRFVVWADYVDSEDAGDKHYNTRNNEGKIDLRNITLKEDTWVAMDETRDAFTGYFDTEDEGKQYTSTSSINITLKRPFAKLRVITTDMVELGHLDIAPAKAVATYTTKFHESFNAFNGEYGDETVEKAHSTAFAIKDYADFEGTEKEDTHKVLFTDYFFADDSDVVKFILDVQEANGNSIKENNFSTDIHVQRNYLTTIQGNILTDGNNVEVKVEDAFAKPDYEVNVYNGIYDETITLASGTYFFNNVTVNTTNEYAVLIAENANVVIDITGTANFKSAGKAIYVPASSTLTINGSSETRSNAQNGKLTVIGGNATDSDTNGSAIAVDGTLIVNNIASLTANGYGKCGYGIGGINGNITIENTTIDYVCGGYIQPLFVNDEKYGKSEPEGAAAIGGANIVIKNSTITKAEGGSKAAAIGNRYWESTNIVIENSTLVDIFGGNASAAIGGSRYASEKDKHHSVTIEIENSIITNAVGGQYGAGIGSGYDTHCQAGGSGSSAVNEITITNSTVTAKGGKYAAGIGTGFHAAALTGSIDAASTINATAGLGFYKDIYTHAQNIGYGIVDPAREYTGTVTFTVAGNVIAAPMCACAEGVAKRDENTFCIYNADGLKWVSDVVNATTPYTATLFDNAIVELMNDIDLNNEEWIPIGDDRSQRTEWHGVFDGKGFTVKNVKITKKTDREDENKSSYGLFGNVKGTVKNLTVENVSISGAPKFIGALIGRLNNGLVENCHVKNSSVECNNWTIGGLVGQFNNGKISGCSVNNTTVKGYAAVAGIAGVALNSGERVIENCSVSGCTFVKNGSFGGNFDKMFGTIVGALYSGTLTVNINNCTASNNTLNDNQFSDICGHVTTGDKLYIDGALIVNTADELKAAMKSNETVIIGSNIEDDTIKLPAELNNFTLKAAAGVTLKNCTISAADGNSYSYENLTFDGITFDNSRIVLTGWRNGEEVIKNLTVTNCVFKNLDDTTNTAPVHINKDAAEAVENFTFTNNVINGATGGSKSGVYAQVTGNVVFENNFINNVSFRPYVIQITTDDNVADTFTVKGNTFSGSSVGRAQGLGNNANGTDNVNLVVSGNIFKDITGAQQICYWNFNPATTTADLSKNYYDIDIEANPGNIYYNEAANSVEDLKAMGVYPFYTALNADGTINLNSLKQAE